MVDLKYEKMKYKNGQALWEKAKTIIPTGNQLLSKKAERFLPGLWPSYYQKAKGCEVWDISGNHYYDFAQMGVGACVLGYANDEVDNAVIEAIQNGSMCTLNSYEEVELAEKMIELHPWSSMVRFARTGGEACAIGVRIARTYTGRDKVAFCGYHGWSDWYLAANIADSSNLDGQLIPGLKPAGVVRSLKHTNIPFNFNKLNELQDIINNNPGEIGVIIMEPAREIEPNQDFIRGVREIANKIGAILIFDEVTSGFRVNLGGIHLKYGVNPDIAIFGKALGNGFPIAAIIGKREVMSAAENSFISSTMWTERVGFVSALKTIEIMEREKVQEKLIYFGDRINEGWNRLAQETNLKIHISGIPPLTHISFDCYDPNAVQTLYTQEMLEKGYLLGSSVYATYAYNNEIIDRFLIDSRDVFITISKAIKEKNIHKYLKNEVIQVGFKRLTGK